MMGLPMRRLLIRKRKVKNERENISSNFIGIVLKLNGNSSNDKKGLLNINEAEPVVF